MNDLSDVYIFYLTFAMSRNVYLALVTNTIFWWSFGSMFALSLTNEYTSFVFCVFFIGLNKLTLDRYVRVHNVATSSFIIWGHLHILYFWSIEFGLQIYMLLHEWTDWEIYFLTDVSSFSRRVQFSRYNRNVSVDFYHHSRMTVSYTVIKKY